MVEITKENLKKEFNEAEFDAVVKTQKQSVVTYNGLSYIRKGTKYYSEEGVQVSFNDVYKSLKKHHEKAMQGMHKNSRIAIKTGDGYKI